MNKLNCIICDICRTIITNNPSIDDRLKKLHICNKPECTTIYETISLSILEDAKDSLSPTYYWDKKRQIQEETLRKEVEYEKSLNHKILITEVEFE